jgi:apolipoprotein D and lipocalin family protein
MSSAGSYANDLAPIKPVAPIDLPHFMGKWYVIASIPTRFENSAHAIMGQQRCAPPIAFNFNYLMRRARQP